MKSHVDRQYRNVSIRTEIYLECLFSSVLQTINFFVRREDFFVSTGPLPVTLKTHSNIMSIFD